MMKRLRIRLIAVTMLSLSLVLLVILGGVNLMSYRKTISDADAILQLLADNAGAFPLRMRGDDPLRRADEPAPDSGALRMRGLSDETPYESRFFSVLLDGDGRVLGVDTGKIAAVDGETATAYALAVTQAGKPRGFTDGYRFLVSAEGGGTRVIFLDCGRSLSAAFTVLAASVALALLGLLAVLALLVAFSGRIVRPVAEGYEKQRRFITDAGHELKTPLTIIGADADLLELELGESEWLADIRAQVVRLTGLTQDLITLSRMDEAQPRLQRIEFPFSDMAEEVAQSFQALARAQDESLALDIAPMLSFTGDEKALRQLVSILLDNAVKYAPAGSVIDVSLAREGRFLRLAVCNPVERPLTGEQLSHLFDRFYRADASRASETGGYGLGMSIARSIVSAHRGKIRAECPEGGALRVTVTLPL